MRWRRLDAPGHEDARVESVSAGWCLTGQLNLMDGGVTAQLRYRIDCDHRWHTRVAVIEGEVEGGPIRVALTADGAGQWTRYGRSLPECGGTLDIDLAFTPATNTLPIRRMALAVGEAAPVRSVWLRFPELRLEVLEQTYIREAERVYRYVAQVDGAPFTARLDTDDYGRVLRYEGLWVAEVTAPTDEPSD